MSQFQRSRLLFGEEALQRLHAAHALVVGLGAVGSFAVEALARSGIGRLTLVDSDAVELSNINRQLYALHTTLGQPKATLAAARCAAIHPAARIDAIQRFVTPENVHALLDETAPDLVIDAIDSVDSKAALLIACHQRGLPVFSSMGAARKTDPTRIRAADISETTTCPLAKVIRRRLLAAGIARGIRCIYSTEPAAPQLPGEALGSFICVTGAIGLTLAREAILFLNR